MPMNHRSAENFIRSAPPPVMIAKVIWNMTKTESGMVPLMPPTLRCSKKARWRLPTKEDVPFENARL